MKYLAAYILSCFDKEFIKTANLILSAERKQLREN